MPYAAPSPAQAGKLKPLRDVTVSADGRVVAAGTDAGDDAQQDPGEILVWSRQDMAARPQVIRLTYGINALAFVDNPTCASQPAGSSTCPYRIAVASDDGSLRKVSLSWTDPQQLAPPSGPPAAAGPATTTAGTAPVLAVITADLGVHQAGSVVHLAVSPDASVVATAGSDRTVRLFSLSDADQIGDSVEGNLGDVQSVDFTSDGRAVVSAAAMAASAYGSAARARTSLDQSEMSATRREYLPVFVAAIDRAGRAAWSAQRSAWLQEPGSDRAERIWTSDSPMKDKNGNDVFTSAVGWGGDGLLAVAESNGSVHVLDTKSRRQVDAWTVGARGRAVAFSPDPPRSPSERTRVSASMRSPTTAARATPAPRPRRTSYWTRTPRSGASPSTRKAGCWPRSTLEAGCECGTGAPARRSRASRSPPDADSGVAFSANGDFLYSAAESGTVDKWSVAGRRLVHKGSVTLGAVTAMALADHDHLAVVGTRAGDLHIIDLAHMRTIGTPLTVSTSQIRSITSNGSTIVVSDDGGRLQVSVVVHEDDDSVLAGLRERVDLGPHDQVCESGAAFDADAFADQMERFRHHPRACP